MKRIIFAILFLPIFFLTAYAEYAVEKGAEITEAYIVEEALPEQAAEISGELKLDGSYDISAALKRLWDKALYLAAEHLKHELGYGLKLTVIALLCSVAIVLSRDAVMPQYINIISCVAASLMIAGNMDGIINEATTALNQLSDYSKAAIPVIFSAAAASGAVVSAAAKYGAVCLAIDVIMSCAQRFVIPMIYTYLAICITRSIFDNPLLAAFARIIKWCATTLMTGITTAFSAYISITGVISGSTDAVAVKTARTIISSSLPVVGGIISDASAVVLSAASIIKNSAGAFALVSICALCAGPFVALSIKMLVFRAAAAAADMLPGGKLTSLINDVGTCFSMLLGLVGCCGIMLFISIMSGMKVMQL